ncbi:hypothetical protein D3C72_2136860 [compost metagenome]
MGLDGPGCSEYVAGATIQDTCGSVPFSASSRRACRKPPSGMVLAVPLYSGLAASMLGVQAGYGEPLAALPASSLARRYCWKPASELSPKFSGRF